MPMPRLTSIPERSSCAMRLAITVCASMASPVGDEIVDDRGRSNDMIGRDHTYRHDMVGSDDDGVGRHGDHRVEVTCRQGVGQIAGVIGKKGGSQGIVGARRRLEQIAFAMCFTLALSLVPS